MTQPDEIWAMVERRAVSSVRGASADDNDEMMRVALAEAPMNPHRQSGGAMASNSPGMMPPMMMGGAGGRGQEAGGSSGLGTGVATSAGSGAAGPTLATQATAPAASLRETQYTSGSGVGAGGGGGTSGGSGSAGGSATSAAGGFDTDGGPEDGAEPPAAPESPAEPSAPRGGGAPKDGFITDPQAVTGMATAWNELKTRLGALDRSETEARLGLVEAAVRPQQAINDLLRMWLDGAVEEAGAMESKLRQAVKDYAAVDDDAIADIRRELPRD